MGSVVGKSIGEAVDRVKETIQEREYEKAKEREMEQQSREGYEIVRYTNEYTIRKYPPYVAARMLNHNQHYDGLLPLSRYAGYGLRGNGPRLPYWSRMSPQNTKGETLMWAKKGYHNILSIVPIPNKAVVVEQQLAVIPELHAIPRSSELRLPDIYTRMEDAPEPWDKRVVLTQVEGRVYGVAKICHRPSLWFGDLTLKTERVMEEADKLRTSLERDGYQVSGDPSLVGELTCEGPSREPMKEVHAEIRIPVNLHNNI